IVRPIEWGGAVRPRWTDPGEDAGRVLGMAGFAVRIDDLRAAAAAFARRRVDAEGLLAANGLGDSAGMAGRDPVLAAWRARYDAVAAAEWAAAPAAAATLGAIATK